MHVNSVEGRGWLGNKVDRCDGLSEISTGGHQPSGAVCSVLGLEARVYFQLWVGLSSALPVQSSPVQPS